MAICKDFLQTGSCPAGDSCDLSHQPTPERSSTCLHFLRGRCTNTSCRYTHVRVNPGAPVCHPFATLGFCEAGGKCEERHVNECPNYANTGACKNKRCRLPHIDRAGQIRKNAANRTGNEASKSDLGNGEDISSEEDDYDEIGSDDIDSDDLEDPEPMEVADPNDGSGLSQQQDFVQF